MVAVFNGGLVIAALLLQSVLVQVYGLPAVLKLERVIPATHQLELSELRARDKLRHGRLLQNLGGVVDLSVEGTFVPALAGLYYTKLKMGTPPREFHVQIDTGSDVLWIGCSSCNGCPLSSTLQIELNFFDPQSSSTASMISCSDRRCSLASQSLDSLCSGQSNTCSYTFHYGDGSGTSGFYVSDLIHFDTLVGNPLTTNSSAPVVFGCSNLQNGDLVRTNKAVDGILGFGQQRLSIISQLASQGLTPGVFSHCLRGDSSGGGILVLGEIVEPNMIYSPLVPSQPHYNLNLQSISMNGQILPIDPSAFSSTNEGAIIDTGTTLAYFPEDAYDPFLEAITNVVSESARPILSKGNHCFLITSSVAETFPQVSLNFEGGASMILNPQEYLLQQNTIGGFSAWCIGFLKIKGPGVTILGDLFLKDKIVVYDLVGQRIGWTNYDCSMSVNVSATSTTGKSEFVNAGQLSNNNSPAKLPRGYIMKITIAFLLHMFILRNFVSLY